MDYFEALEKLNTIQQPQLLNFWENLSQPQQFHLLQEIEDMDIDTFRIQRSLIKTTNSPNLPNLETFSDYSKAGNSYDSDLGIKLIEEGRLGCLIVAGGQGTRLRFNGPKGIFPVTIVKHKSLFQIFAEKVLAASKMAKRPLPLAIMTSPSNHEITCRFFKENHWFGLEENQINFFSQKSLPFLDLEGNLFLEEPYKIAKGPDGNGSALNLLWSSGIVSKWLEKGVEFINFILIDNPLADPFDSELLGFHYRNKNDMTIKCTPRRDVKEKVGVLMKVNGKTHVIEYSELPENERFAINSDGNMKHICANISLFCFSLKFIGKFIEKHRQLPLHKALKAAKYFSAEDCQLKEKMAWKFEKFIFDILSESFKVKALLFPRDICFSPLKNLSGEDSLVDVQAAIQKRDCYQIEKITGFKPPERPFELSQDFYYPTPELLLKWKGKSLPDQDYIQA